jgi:hypothetical protein
MATPAPRSYTGLAVAIVVGALIVGASICVAFSGVSTITVTDTETLPVTTTISTTTVCLSDRPRTMSLRFTAGEHHIHLRGRRTDSHHDHVERREHIDYDDEYLEHR